MPDLVFDLSPRRALSALTDDNLTTWRLRYCPQEGLEMRARATLANVERELRAAGAEVTIHALWVALADRAGQEDEPDVKAAVALAGMAMRLRVGAARGSLPVAKRGAAAGGPDCNANSSGVAGEPVTCSIRSRASF